MSVTMMVVAGVVVILMVVRRIYGEPLRASRLLAMPLIELAIGGYEMVKNHGLPAGEWVSLAITGALSLVLGAARGSTLDLFERRGYLWNRYRVRTFLVWAVAFVARFGVRWILAATGVTAAGAVSVEAVRSGHFFTGPLVATLLITSGLGFLGESMVLTPRARATGVPLAPAGARGGGLLGGLLGGLSGDDGTGRRVDDGAQARRSEVWRRR